MVMELLRAGEVHEDDDSYQSPLDELYERLEMREPEHIEVKYYRLILQSSNNYLIGNERN